MNRSERRSWDRYVAEAREVHSEVELPGGEVLTVYIPTADQATRLQKSMSDPELSIWDQLESLLGPENLGKLRAVAEDAPITALTKLLEDVLVDLGLQEPGNSLTSSS